jgi:hypothetical protein
MLEFIFFHQAISGKFSDFLTQRELAFKLDEHDDYINIGIAEDIDDALIDEIEQLYDQLLDESREQVDSDEGEHADNYQKASLLISLNSGDATYAHVDSAVLSRVLQAISKDELNQLICAIADAVENRDDRSYCQIVRDTGDLPPNQ